MTAAVAIDAAATGAALAPEVAAALVAVLRDGAVGERCLAARALGRIGGRVAVADLIAALRDADPDLRTDAAVALRELGDARAAGPLSESLAGDPCAAVKLAAIAALADFGGSADVSLLRRLVRGRDGDVAWDDAAFYAEGWDDWIDVQAAAVAALGRMRAAEAVADIRAALADEDSLDLTETGFRALAGMGRHGRDVLGEYLDAASPRTRRRAAAALAGITDCDIAAPLAKALNDPVPEVRLAALRARLCCAPGDPLLAGMIFDPAPPVQAMALRHATTTDRDLLAAFLDADAPEVRAAALARCTGLPEFATDPDAVALVARLTGDADGTVAAAAATALVALDAKHARALLVPALADAERPAEARLAALRALAGLGDAAPVAALVAAAGDTVRQIRIEALAALAVIARHDAAWPSPASEALAQARRLGDPDPAPDPAIAEPETPTDAGQAQAEARPAADKTLDVILEASAEAGRRPRRTVPTPDPKAETRLLAVRLLGDIPRPEAAAELAQELACDGLTAAAAEALSRIAAAGVTLPEAAVRGLRDATRSPDRALVAAALRALGECGAGGETACLAHHLGNADPMLRSAAAEALATAGQAELAAPLLDDADAAVRLAAARAVATMGNAGMVAPLIGAALTGAGDLTRPVARLLREAHTPAANAALLAVLGDPARRRQHAAAIEMLEEINRRQTETAPPALHHEYQTLEE